MKKTILLFTVVFVGLLCNAQSYNFEQGVKAFKEEEYDKALEYFGREINDNPKNAGAYHYCAIIYFDQDKNGTALSEINAAIKYYSPKDKIRLSKAHVVRGNIYLKIENFEKTFDDYATAIKFSPSDPDIYIDRAQIYFDLKQYSKAEADYRQVIKIDESLTSGWAGLGRNYLALKNYKEAEKILGQLIKLSPEYSGSYLYRSQVYYEQNKYDEAIDDVFQCLLLNYDGYTRNLFIEYSKKNYPLSLSKVNAQISSHPEEARYYFLRAQLFEGKNNLMAAVADYTKMIELSDIEIKPNLLIYRADCYSNSGMYKKSIGDYSESISIDSSNAYNWGRRADTKRLMGDYDGAIEDFTKAINIEPREAFFYYKRGWTREFKKDFEGALPDYDEAISINKKYTYSYLNRGRLYELHLNKPLKAKDDYLTILSLDTMVSNGGNCRQYALFHLGQNGEAIAWLNKILEKYPTDGIYYDGACLYSLMNKPIEAISHMEIAFQKGYRDFIHLSVDDDLDNIRDLPEFKNLVLKWKNIFNESLKNDSETKASELDKEFKTFSIPMNLKGSGTYEVSCKINDLRLNMIFDTGASDISISQTEAQFMLKNGYLNENDITGSQRYMDANGDIELGTTIIFRKVDFGGLILKNVKAAVVHNKNAPLLFGQSALSKYGKITIDNENKIISITTMTPIK